MSQTEVLRSRPRLWAADAPMTASSHYPSSLSPQHQALSGHSNHHTVHASFTSWHGPYDAPQPLGLASALLHQPSPYAPRQLPGDFPDAGPLHYANPHALPSAWAAARYDRPSWSASLGDDGFASRAAEPFAAVDGGRPVPQPYAAPTPTAQTAQPAQSEPHAHKIEDQTQYAYADRRLASTDASFLSHGPHYAPIAPRAASLETLLNRPPQVDAPLQLSIAPFASQTGTDYSKNSPVEQPYNPSHTNAITSSEMVPVSPYTIPDRSWENETGGSYNIISAVPAAGPHEHSLGSMLACMPPPTAQPAYHRRRRSTRSKSGSMPSPLKQSLTAVTSSYNSRARKSQLSARKGPLSEEGKENASERRKKGDACARCRMYKLQCRGRSPNTPCFKCLQALANPRVWNLECLPDRIHQTPLIRICNGRFNQSNAEFLHYEFKDSQIRTMYVTWSLPGSGPVSTTEYFFLSVREHCTTGNHDENMAMEFMNTAGQVARVKQPPYAAHDPQAVLEGVEGYFYRHMPKAQQWLFDRVRHDEIAYITFEEAIRLQAILIQHKNGSLEHHAGKLLSVCFEILYLSVASQGYGNISSSDIPNIQEYDFRELGHSKYPAYDRNDRNCPLPASVNHQMDVAFITALKRCRQDCLRLLNKLIYGTKSQKPWYILHLAFFILIWNLEYMHSGATEYVNAKIGTHVESQVKHVISKQLGDWDYAFDLLLYYWRAVLRKERPFKAFRANPNSFLHREEPDELIQKYLPDTGAFQYMQKLTFAFHRTGIECHTPPATGFTSYPNSMSSVWMRKMFEAGGM